MPGPNKFSCKLVFSFTFVVPGLALFSTGIFDSVFLPLGCVWTVSSILSFPPDFSTLPPPELLRGVGAFVGAPGGLGVALAGGGGVVDAPARLLYTTGVAFGHPSAFPSSYDCKILNKWHF